MNFENVIFSNLIFREDYGRKVIPFLKEEYFTEQSEKILFKIVEEYVSKYNNFPTQESLSIELSTKEKIDQKIFNSTMEIVNSLVHSPETDLDWLIDKTEKFCQEKAVYNGIVKSLEIIENKDNKLSKGSIPQILSDALSVSFDTSIGHNWLEDSDARFEFYKRKEDRVPFDLHYLNLITKGGLPNKTLNIILAGTGVGKSLAMCHFASNNLLTGKNVLYITMEMAEERIAERIDANLFDIPIADLENISKVVYDKKMKKIKMKPLGKLIIKEYPTASAGSANFRYLINELKLKKNFKPDIIYIDYLNICTSSRLKMGSNVNSYTYIKAIAEELRGLAVEFNVPIVSATQTTRNGFKSSDLGLEDTSESFGLPATADFMMALISTESLQELNQIMVKQLKNRYTDVSHNKRFVIGVDRSKMRLYDVEESSQADIIDDGPDEDSFSHSTKRFDKNKFEGFM
jgi:replicative DNA helicase